VARSGAVQALKRESSQGFGMRCLIGGAWGFAASDHLEREEVDRVVDLALRVARASGLASRRPVELGPPQAARGTYVTPVERDPLAVPLSQKVALLLDAEALMRRTPGVSVAEASLEVVVEKRTFASTEGALTHQHITEVGGGLEAVAADPHSGTVQKRSFPNSFGRHQLCGGYEVFERMALVENAARTAEQAVQLLAAPVCPSGVRTIILDGTQAALQVHESCGHPTELDRALRMEASYAGTSFMTPDLLGSLRYGSEAVNLVADATSPGGLGTFGWDDEGVPAQRVDLVREGLFVGYLSSRETASQLGLTSSGAMRADGWNRIPLIRMTNINLVAPPDGPSLEQLIADTPDGLLMETNRSWSIDDRRLNFQFGTEMCREIVGGKLGKIYRDATYTGMTPQFWGACDRICGPAEWRMWGVVNCGKGEPGQVMHVGHGAAPARFQGVRVGIL
jgi:TldD protein